MSYSSEVLADSPWGFWRCTETGGATLADSSGNARDMTITGSPTLAGPGPALKAISWPADLNTYAKTATTYSSTTGVTLEAWVYLTATPTSNALVMQLGDFKDGSGSNNVALWIDSAGKPNFYYYNAGANILTGSSALSLNTWHHIVGVGTTSAATCRLRVDKATVASGPPNPIHPSGYGNAVWLHAGYNATAQALKTAEPSIYPSALSDARIDAHFDAAAPDVLVAGESAIAAGTALDGAPLVAVRVNGDSASTTATALDGTIPVTVPIIVAGESAPTAATALDGLGKFRVPGDAATAGAVALGGDIVGAAIVVEGEPAAADTSALTGIAFTPPLLSGLGLVLDSAAVLTVDVELEPEPTVPAGTPSTVLHIIAPTVPVPTLVAGRPL